MELNCEELVDLGSRSIVEAAIDTAKDDKLIHWAEYGRQFSSESRWSTK
jgi:hypothetical protein